MRDSICSLGILAVFLTLACAPPSDHGTAFDDTADAATAGDAPRVPTFERALGPFVANQGQFPDETVVAASTMGAIQVTLRPGSLSLRPEAATQDFGVTLRFGEAPVDPLLEAEQQTRFSFLY